MSTEYHSESYPTRPSSPHSGRSDAMLVALPIESQLSSSSGIWMPSSYRPHFMIASYLLPLLVTIVVAASTHNYVVFLAPCVCVITVLLALTWWIRNFIVRMNVAQDAPIMTKQQLICLILAQFTLGFWVAGMIMCAIVSLEFTVLAYIPIHSQAGSWTVLVIVCYFMFAVQYWGLLYLITKGRSRVDSFSFSSSPSSDFQLESASFMAIALGCTTATLWVGFVVFASHIKLLTDVTGFPISSQHDMSIMILVTLISITLLPMDAYGAIALVCNAHLRMPLDETPHAANRAGGRGTGASTDLLLNVLFRGSLLMCLCLLWILLVPDSYLTAVSVYLIMTSLLGRPYLTLSARTGFKQLTQRLKHRQQQQQQPQEFSASDS